MADTLKGLRNRVATMEKTLVDIPRLILDDLRSDRTPVAAVPEPMLPSDDAWRDRSTFICGTCRHWRHKKGDQGRCRRNAPTMQGYPVVFHHEVGCGEHKLA